MCQIIFIILQVVTEIFNKNQKGYLTCPNCARGECYQSQLYQFSTKGFARILHISLRQNVLNPLTPFAL